MGTVAKPLLLNLGCGTQRWATHCNVDAFGDVDVRWDLNKFPYPWEDNSVDGIDMYHVLEHLDDWWSAFKECARILKPGGYLEIRVPDESSMTALTYRDHNHVFSKASFWGIDSWHNPGTNTWAATETRSVPLQMTGYFQVPFAKYHWMIRWCPNILRFCADHLRNFIHEQRFIFTKVGQ